MQPIRYPNAARRPWSAPAIAALAAVLAIAGCASEAGRRPVATCSDAGLGWAVGEQATEDVMRRLLAESGTGLINPIGPKTRVSRDSRPDRLRVFIDADNVITRVACE